MTFFEFALLWCISGLIPALYLISKTDFDRSERTTLAVFHMLAGPIVWLVIASVAGEYLAKSIRKKNGPRL